VAAFPLLVIVHALAATGWTGGHLVLDLGVLPRALREQSAAAIRSFEETFEPLGLTALAIQVISVLWMAWLDLSGFRGLFDPANPIGMLVGHQAAAAGGHRCPGAPCPAAADPHPQRRQPERRGLVRPRHHRPGDRLRGGGSADPVGWMELSGA
jgi:hypothetical protein